MKNNEELYYGQSDEREKWHHLIPIILILFMVPLIVYLKVVPLNGAALDYWKGTPDNADFFSYYKAMWFLAFTVITAIIFAVKLFKNRFTYTKTYFYIPSVVYIVCIVLSTVLSEHKSIALGGFPDRYEGLYVLVSYIIIMILTVNLLENENHINLLTGALFSSAAVISIIGIFQFIGYDLFSSDFGKSMILPAKYESAKSSLKFLFDKNTIYATLFHSNYVGSYTAMLLPFSFAVFLLTGNKKYKILSGLLTALMFATWLGSNSRAGMVGGVIGLIVFALMIRKFIRRNSKYFIISLIVFAASLVALNVISGNKVLNQVNRLITNGKAIFIHSNVDAAQATSLPLKNVTVEGKNISIIINKETLNIELNGSEIIFKDAERKTIQSKIENGSINLVDERYKLYNVKLVKYNEMIVLQCIKDNITMNFGIVEGEFKMLDGLGKPFDIKPVERIGFEGKESLGSARGYIWSRTLPLILKKPIFGYGPDNFAVYFPQHDFMGKYSNYEGRMWEIVDKPHNLYLQMAVSTGVPSLIAFLSLVVMYFISSVKVFFSNEYKDSISIIGVGIFAAIMGYLGAGFFNDSVVSVAPVFWVLLGIGVNINLKLAK